MLKPHVTEGLRTSQASGPCNRWAVSKSSALCLSESLTQFGHRCLKARQVKCDIADTFLTPEKWSSSGHCLFLKQQNWVMLALGRKKYHGTLQYRNVTQSLFQFRTDIYGHALSWMHIHKDLSRILGCAWTTCPKIFQNRPVSPSRDPCKQPSNLPSAHIMFAVACVPNVPVVQSVWKSAERTWRSLKYCEDRRLSGPQTGIRRVLTCVILCLSTKLETREHGIKS